MSLWGPGYFSNRLASGFGPSSALIQTVDHDVATKTYVNTITKPAALVQTITASGGTTQLDGGSSDLVVIVSGMRHQTVILPNVESLTLGSTVTIVWNITSANGQNGVTAGTGTSLNNFAFGGARAVYKLLSNSSNTAARNWLLISVSGVRPSFEACQTTPQSLTASVMTEIISFKEKIDNINCFNMNTGVFRCAASRLYLIYSTVVFERAAADYYGNVFVYKNRKQYRQISGGGGNWRILRERQRFPINVFKRRGQCPVVWNIKRINLYEMSNFLGFTAVSMMVVIQFWELILY